MVVPPSNPVAEPELDALLGDEVRVYSDRLPVFAGMDLVERNRRYVPAYANALDELAGLDLACALIAMTGPNYRLGVEGDSELCATLSEGLGASVRTTSLASYDALKALGIDRIHLVSPYPEWLTEDAVRYWEQAGIAVIDVESFLAEGEKFRAYETRTGEVVAHLTTIDPEAGSAVMLTGTGLGSVAAIHRIGGSRKVPILSSDLCGAWWILKQCGNLPGSELYRSVAPSLATEP